MNYQLQNEVSKANFNISKRIYNWLPFMKVVYWPVTFVLKEIDASKETQREPTYKLGGLISRGAYN